jgi:biotin transport system substrate-specific component
MSRILFVLLFTSLTAFSAFVAIKVPFLAIGVPRTLPGAEALYQVKGLVFGSHVISAQLLMVWMTGALLGPRRGGLAMALYLAVGLGGLPIFTNGGGFGYFFQPTFGYLASFVPAVIVVGLYARDHRFGRTWMGMFIGLATIQLFGLFYELVVRGRFFSGSAWVDLGWVQVLQFLPGQLALLTAAAALVAGCRKLDAAYLAWTDEQKGKDQEPVLPTA